MKIGRLLRERFEVDLANCKFRENGIEGQCSHEVSVMAGMMLGGISPITIMRPR
jgi:hypothetical protein